MAILVQLRILALTPTSLVTSYLTPLALAAVIMSLYGRPTGALVVGTVAAAIWNTLLLQSFFIVSQERAWGTMELLATTPAGLVASMLGRLIGAVVQAIVAIPFTLGLSLAAGGVPALGPWTLVLASLAVILTGLTGAAFLHMALIIRYRSYTAFINGVFPLSIVFMGFFTPTERMPLGIGTIGRALAPTWAMDAIRQTSWQPLIMGAVTAGALLVAAAWYVSHLRQWIKNSPSAYQH